MSTRVSKRVDFRSKQELGRWLIPLALIGALLGGVFGMTRPATATATSSLYVSSAKPETGVDSSQLTNTVLSKMYSYYKFTQSNTVLQPVIDKLKLDTTVNELRSSVQASVPEDSMVIEVSVEADAPEQAALIANAVRDSLRNAVLEMTPDQAGGSPSVEVFRYQDAAQATTVSQPSPLLYAMVGALLGALAAFAIASAMRARPQPRRENPASSQVADPQ